MHADIIQENNLKYATGCVHSIKMNSILVYTCRGELELLRITLIVRVRNNTVYSTHYHLHRLDKVHFLEA